METICGDDLLPGSVEAEPSESNGADVQTPSESQKSMAFTIHFADSKGNATARNLRENLGRFPFRHTRNWSLSAVGEDKKNVNETALQAIGLSPLPSRKLVLTRRAGYHSEGYFSSDQEEDMRSKSDIFVQKLKTAERGVRTTNLAQEKKILAEHSSQIKAKLMSACEKQQIEKFFERDRLLSDEVKEKRHNTSLNNVASPFEDIDANCKEEWLVASTNDDNDIEIRVQTQNPDEMIDDIEEVINDSSNDTVSEAGTYTIERDVPCPEEDEARKELENVIGFMKSAQEKDIDQTEEQKGSEFKMSLYRDNPNWINEWANQVAKHNHESEYEKSDPMSLPPLPLGKPVLSSKGLPPSGRKLTPSPQHSRNHLFQSPVAISSFQDFSQKQDVVGSERHSDSSLETESFLRATESVVTAMQARMTLSVDSGGESDVDTSHSYSRTIVGDRGPVTPFRRASNASDTSARQGEGRQSDSSSETGEGRLRSGTIPAPGSTPQMRYNRAFSLRRARLDNEPEPAESKKNKSLTKAESPTPSSSSRSKKMTEPPKPAPSRLKSKSTKPETPALSRTESARASMRAQRQTPQPSSRQGLPKKEIKKSGGGRSNSTLSSREVEFQNWKRRKSYDPMKAAAEGKKKEAAKKALPLSTSMTQSCIPDVETSPSRQNPVLRSASFHGTGEMTPSYASSEEEEVTLSADEDSPISAHPHVINVASPVQASADGAFGGSRVSLHSAASNSSLRGRSKIEALDNLIVAAMFSVSQRVKGSSCKVLKKLRYLYEEDSERSEKLGDVIELLENTGGFSSPQNRSPSKDLSATLKTLKCVETVFKVLDEVLFDEEDFGLDDGSYQCE